MPRIHCFYDDCIFLEKGFCTALTIELDPDDGCLTYSEDPGDLNIEEFAEDDEGICQGGIEYKSLPAPDQISPLPLLSNRGDERKVLIIL